ncbi:GDP-mannose 4,6-dehydratase [bacterium]|nr:GDP-mannose 4,6-dehydratase [bacterium]
MATVLVTGAAGYLGSHVADALIARGDRVIGLDNFDPVYPRSVKEANLAQAKAGPGFCLVEADILCADRLGEVFTRYRPDSVMHLAARGGVRESIRQPAEYLSVNVQGTLNVLQAAAEAEVLRFVFASSSSVYGIGTPTPFSEDALLNHPASPYAASKIAAEAYCHVYHHLRGLPVVVARIFNPVGPRQRPGMAIRKFARRMMEGLPIPVYGDGSTSRDYTSVHDMVRGLLMCLEVDRDDETINLGHCEPVALRDLIACLEECLGVKARLERMPEQPGDVPVTCADLRKAERLLGWVPEIPYQQAVAEFVDWYRVAGEVCEDSPEG